MAIVLLYNFRIVSARRDSLQAGRDLPFQFDKSWNLSFSIIFGFKTIIFDKFIVYYRFLSFSIGFLSTFIVYYQISIEFISNSIEFYQFRTIRYDRGIL